MDHFLLNDDRNPIPVLLFLELVFIFERGTEYV